MNKEQRIDLNSLRVGDKVTLTFEVYSNTNLDAPVYLRHGVDEDFCLVKRHDYYGTIERAPRPLEVGDRVTWPTTGAAALGKILCIAGTQAWVENEFGGRCTFYLHELTRIES